MRFSRKNLGIPYMLFLILFVIAPLAVLFYYAFTNGSGQFTLMNFIGFFTNPNTVGTLFYSLAIAAVTTIVCVLLAYPLAYILATSHFRAKSVIVMIFVMPMWINFSLRITALKEVLTFLEGNLAMHPFLNAVIGMSYDFLPFMILPIYTTISRLDRSLLEAAADLDAGRHQRRLDGLPAGDDELCRTRHAVQQHLYHGIPHRKLLLRVQLARRLHDRTDPAGIYLPLHPADRYR